MHPERRDWMLSRSFSPPPLLQETAPMLITDRITAAVDDLRARVTGTIVLPGDADYETARLA